MSPSAIPKYLGTDFSSASPALRFGPYLSAGANPDDKKRAWKSAAGLTPQDKICAEALNKRQSATLKGLPDGRVLELSARSVSPFATGLGIEHPLENGFAFLSPYGLPYLPSSGVKGVVRRAAEELAHRDLFKDGDWTLPAIWHLFGFERWSKASKDEWVNGFALDLSSVEKYLHAVLSGDPDLRDRILEHDDPRTILEEHHLHVRGALAFWDVVPVPHGRGLDVEVMTPHYSHYYQDSEHVESTTPHDSGKPNPIHFLVVPPGSSFVFRVICDVDRLQRVAPELAKDNAWKTFLRKAFHHAYEWVGFGAKTAVGYGAMQQDHREVERERKLREEQETARLRQQEERKRREAAEATRRRQEAEQQRVQALSPAQRYKEQVDGALAKHDAAGYGEKKVTRNELLGLANAAENEARDWSAEDRQNTAALVEHIFDIIGWGDPGGRSKQKKRQELKRRAIVENLRSPK